MTNEECDAALGRIVRDYVDTCRKEVCFRSEIRRSQESVSKLETLLKTPENALPLREDGRVIGFNTATRSGFPLNIETLSGYLDELRGVVEKKERIEEQLRSAGLSDLIRGNKGGR